MIQPKGNLFFKLKLSVFNTNKTTLLYMKLLIVITSPLILIIQLLKTFPSNNPNGSTPTDQSINQH